VERRADGIRLPVAERWRGGRNRCELYPGNCRERCLRGVGDQLRRLGHSAAVKCRYRDSSGSYERIYDTDPNDSHRDDAMSIADAVRARDLEARVTALEQRVEETTNAELEHRVKMLQGQLNSLRAKVDRLVPAGPPETIDAA
jgi:hypothetical protein